VIYQDGRAVPDTDGVITTNGPYCYDGTAIAKRAANLPADLRITLNTPLRIKARGAFIEMFDLGAIVQAACWRLNALATFWVDWERTSSREPQPRKMKLGGIVGGAVLRSVPEDVRALLLAGSLAHVGKACVFGHGRYDVAGV
jgi:hypothetical protein